MAFWIVLSPSIWLISFPQTSYTFGSVPLAGLILNLFAPAFFSFAFSLTSTVALLHLAGLPLTSWLLDAVEGAFSLWALLANGLVSLIPWTVSWGPFTSWCGAGLLFLWLCRAMRLSWARTALVASMGSAAAFLIFL